MLRTQHTTNKKLSPSFSYTMFDFEEAATLHQIESEAFSESAESWTVVRHLARVLAQNIRAKCSKRKKKKSSQALQYRSSGRLRF